ncbi:MAG: type II toxin-antitoxin system ParD family antitoxin [Cyanobacteria bacterium J06643_4]
MNLSLSPELAQFVQAQVATGKYSSESEVALAGIMLLKDIDSLYRGRYEELRSVVTEGVAAADRGELLDSDSVFARLQRKLDQKRQQSQ